MQLDDHILRLIAIGASVAANCRPCLETNVSRALEQGADRAQVAEAIAIGRMVREGAASGTNSVVSALLSESAPLGLLDEDACGCGPAFSRQGVKNG
jgi:AhpD family alkylhydroperoxidase